MPGTARHAPSISASKPPAVILSSKPRSSTVPPTTSRPSRRGHQIAPRKPDDMVQQRVRRIHLQRQHLTFYWTDQGEVSRWNPSDLARPRPGSQHDNIRRFAAVLRHGRGYTPAGDLNLADRIMLVKYGPGLAGRPRRELGRAAGCRLDDLAG